MNGERGFTFIEMIVVTTILLVLASTVMPLAQVTMQRQREAELHRALREMRTAHRQVQGRRRSGSHPVNRTRAGQRRLSAWISKRSSMACRWPTTRRGGNSSSSVAFRSIR